MIRLSIRGILQAAVAISALAVPALSRAQVAATPTSTPATVRAMHARYVGRWWKTLTFRQKSIYFEPDGKTRVEYWTEAEQLPGSLRVVTEPASNGNVRLYTRDSTYAYTNGTLASRRAGLHPLLVLLLDVFAVDPAVTIRRLPTMLIDTTAFRRETWQGRPMLVLGALRTDAAAREAWIDAERLILVRLLQSSTTARVKTVEYRIGGHRRVAGGWLEGWLETWEDGKRTFREEYENELVNPKLDPRLFDPDIAPANAPVIPLAKTSLPKG